jgi:hypothetical protein
MTQNRWGTTKTAFAANYQEDEYTLLSMAIKYTGLGGQEVRVIGKTEVPSVKTEQSSRCNRPIRR